MELSTAGRGRAHTAAVPVLVLALVVALVVGAAACGGAPVAGGTSSSPASAAPVAGGSLVVAWTTTAQTLDPALAAGAAEKGVVRAVYQGLLRYDGRPGAAGTVLVPCLATVVPNKANGGLSHDGLTYTFTLRRGVAFHPPVNRDLRAADVKYTLERLLRTAPAATRRPYMGIAGAARFVAGDTGELSGVSVVDDLTRRIRLVRPDPLFLAALAADAGGVLPREWVERWGPELARRPLGTGPFVFVDWTADERIELARNPRYWEPGRPRLDAAVFALGQTPAAAVRGLQAGAVDVLGFGITRDELEALGGAQIAEDRFAARSLLAATYLFLNTRAAPFDDGAVRRAVSLAIDRERLARIQAEGGAALWQLYPRDLPGYDPALTLGAYNPERARALLRAAGHGDGLHVTLTVARGAWEPACSASVRADLAAVGIRTTLRELSPRAYRRQLARPRGPAMGLVQWQPGLVDPGAWTDALCGCRDGRPQAGNAAEWCSAAFARQRAAADALADPAARLRAYTALQRPPAAAAPYVPLTTTIQTSACSPFVGGFYLHPVYQLDLASYWKQ